MLFKTTLLLTGLAAASQALEFGAAFHQPNGADALMSRSTQCKEVAEPNCESSCGEGYKNCVHPNMCFNPINGESCCENGTFCPAGTYCAEGGCCPNNMSLEECKTVQTLTLISPTRSSIEPTTVLTTTLSSTSTTTQTITTWVEPSPEPSPEPTPEPSPEPSPEPEPQPSSEPEPEPAPTTSLELPSTIIINPTRVTTTVVGTGTGSWPSSTPGTNGTITTPVQPPQQTSNDATRTKSTAAAFGLSIIAMLSGLM